MRWALVVVSLALSGCFQGGQPTGSTSLALTGASIIDGTGTPPQADSVVLVRDGHIIDVGPTSRVVIPRDARVIDVMGKYVLPGLVDAHVHLDPKRSAVESYLQLQFEGGVTAVRDMAGDSFLYSQMRSTTHEASAKMSRLYYSATWAGPSYWNDRRWVGSTQGKAPGTVAWARAIDPSSDLTAEVAAARALGATGIKVYSDLQPDVVSRIPAAAHAQGLRVWSHPVVFPTKPSQVVRSGVDVISHAALFVWEGATRLPVTYHTGTFTDFGPPAPYDSVPVQSQAVIAVLEEMKRRSVLLDATVSTIPHSVSDEAARWAYELTATARQMGIAIVAGTDRDAFETDDGIPLYGELEALIDKCGLTTGEAITAATLNGARALGVEKEFGTIEKGRVADLIVVDANPLSDIKNLRRVAYVIKGGYVHEPARHR